MSYDQLNFVDDGTSQSWTVDFKALGYPETNPKDTRQIIIYYVNHVQNIPYVYPNSETTTNMATLDYTDAWSGVERHWYDGAHWDATASGAEVEADTQLVAYTINKTWLTTQNPKPNVRFNLLANGEPAKYNNGTLVPPVRRVMKDGTTKLIITDLPYADADGNRISYTASEADPVLLPGYSDVPLTDYIRSGTLLDYTFYAVNTRVLPVTATKVWSHNTDHPTIYFQLWRQVKDGDGVIVDEKVPDVDLKELPNGTTKVTWDPLPETNLDNIPYTYYVKEVDGEGNPTEPRYYDKFEEGLSVTNTFNPKSSFTFAKSVDKTNVTLPGEEVTYTFTVTNTGETELTNLVITDPMLETIEPPKTTLAEGESLNFGVKYQLKASDFAGTERTNLAKAEATNPSDEKLSHEATATIITTKLPSSISLTKTVDKAEYHFVGDVLKYTFTVKNTGETILKDIVITDPMFHEIVLTKTTLNPGEETTVTASYTIQAKDLVETGIVNRANVSGTTPYAESVQAEASATAAYTSVPSGLKFEKLVDKVTFKALGEKLTFTFSLTNTGQTELTKLTLNDPMFKDLIWDKTSLKPGEVARTSAEYVITAKDISAKQVLNQATVSVTTPDGNILRADGKASSIYTRNDAQVSFTKTVRQENYLQVGDALDYTFTVKNTGQETVTISLIDPMFKSVTLDKTTLEPGQTAQGAAKYLVTKADLDRKR